MSSYLVCDRLGLVRSVPHTPDLLLCSYVTLWPENIHKIMMTPGMASFVECYRCVFRKKNTVQSLISLAEVIIEILFLH